MRKLKLCTMMVAFILVFGAAAQAATITFNKYVKFSGTPELPTFEAVITDIVGGVQITMTNISGTDAEEIFSWFFNIVPPIPSPLTVNYVSGQEALGQGPTPGVQLGEDMYKADGDGLFDLVFTYPNAGGAMTAEEFTPGETSVYQVLGAINVGAFLATSTPAGGQGPYYSAVEQSAWWGQESKPTGMPVPEPCSALLLGFGLIGLAGIASKKRNC